MTKPLNMQHIDIYVFLPQIAAILLLCLTGIMPLQTAVSAPVMLHFLGTIAIVSFLAGLTYQSCIEKNVPPFKYMVTVFFTTLGIGFLLK